jgi:MoaA/NifB/PqqE/SkfB family radical SAM enzyme
MNKNLPFNFYLASFLEGWKKILFHNGPLFFTFFITSKCNANCKHCFYWHRINATDNELTLEEIDKISKSMPSFSKLLISGGEPFLRRDIDKICEIFYSNNMVRQITIPTNGILTETIHLKIRSILDFCKNAHVQIQISIDGLGQCHDNIRGADKTFEKAMQTYYSLRDLEKNHKNFEINFCFTFSSLNQDLIKNVHDYLTSKGINNFSVLLIREPVKDGNILKIDFKKYAKWHRYTTGNFIYKNKNLSECIFAIRRDYQMDIIERTIENKKFKFKCLSGILTAVMDERGFVYPCENRNTPFGSLREEGYNFNRIWHNKSANNFRRNLFLTKCRCTHETNIMTNISFSPYFYLLFFIKFLRLRLICKGITLQ